MKQLGNLSRHMKHRSNCTLKFQWITMSVMRAMFPSGDEHSLLSIVWCLSLFGVTIIEYHCLRWFIHNRNLSLMVLEAGKSKIKLLTDSVSGETAGQLLNATSWGGRVEGGKQPRRGLGRAFRVEGTALAEAQWQRCNCCVWRVAGGGQVQQRRAGGGEVPEQSRALL